MSTPTSLWLLDKNVVRNALHALAKLDVGQPLLASELPTLEVLRAAREGDVYAVISIEVTNILRCRENQPNVRLILATLPTFRATRYFKRWARRLRDAGFTGEDAKVIALATFGVDEMGTRFGGDAIVTGDLALIRNYEQQFLHYKTTAQGNERSVTDAV